MRHERGKSDAAIVAAKPANEAVPAAEEQGERRAATKGNAGQHSTSRTPSRTSVTQALDRIRRTARERKKERFTALLHHINLELLEAEFFALSEHAAAGADGVTWRDYEQNLKGNLEDLQARVHRGAYRPLPSRRVYIPKPDGRQRPLAIAALEDKIVQRATATVLNAIYEEDFLGFSYGFRPGRSAHDAMDALVVAIERRRVNFIVDADIRSFFDTVDQKWLIRFVEHRIGDQRIIRLIRKWLRAGVLEDGIVSRSERGTAQGAVISPLLANLYLHYALDLWAERYRRREATGDMILVRYADDFIVGFEHEHDARRFLDALRERLKEFALSLHPEKTRLIEFGRFAADNRQRRGLGKPETFTFLGFTFICSKSKRGRFQIRRKSRRDRAGEDPRAQGGAATAHAPVDSRTGKMAEAGRHRLLQLPCGADQQSDARRLPLLCHRTLEADAPAAQPNGRHDLDADDAARQRLAPQAARPSSMAASTLRRQSPEVGAGCGTAARPDLVQRG
jgi:RNA-directed DNA polymerase